MLCAEDRIDTAFFPSGQGSQCGLIHNDHLATPHKMTDSSGAVVWYAYYKPFGAATVTVSTITNNLRFPGQYFDAETGLNQNWRRDYNFVTGRYIEADPIGLRGEINLYRRAARAGKDGATRSEMNLYSYTGSNPAKYIDPWGLWSLSFGGYAGWGGGIVVGVNPDGGLFISFRGGYGIGGGVSYDPNGKSTGYNPCQRNNGMNVSVGGFGEANVGLGPGSVGLSGGAGGTFSPGNVSGYTDGGFTYGGDWGWSLRGGADGGIEITFH